MKHAATRDLFAYWNALRGGRAAPERGDVDPTAIREVLADTFMLDADFSSGFPFRLAGTRVNALFDAEQKGHAFLDLWQAVERRNIAAVLMTVSDGACPVVAGATAAPRGQEECAFELLFLPLRHHGKTHSRLLGLVKATTQPAWLGLLPVGPLSLRSLRIVEAPEAEAQPSLMAVGQDATPPRMYFGDVHSGGSAPTTRPYLQVIQGGRV